MAGLVAARRPVRRPSALVWSLLLDGFVTPGFIVSATVRRSGTPNAVLGRVSAVSALANALARTLGVASMGVLLAVVGLLVLGISGAGRSSTARSARPARR